MKNVTGLPRPVPYEVDLQHAAWFQEWAAVLGVSEVELSSIVVKLCYAGLFLLVLAVLTLLSETALRSPWGRMMRAIRANETAAGAMGKDVTARHLQVFVLGSAVIGIAGAMHTTLDGQFTPASYQPLRFTFLIWVIGDRGWLGQTTGAPCSAASWSGTYGSRPSRSACSSCNWPRHPWKPRARSRLTSCRARRTCARW